MCLELNYNLLKHCKVLIGHADLILTWDYDAIYLNQVV